MMKRLAWLRPDRLAVQIVLLVLASMAFFQFTVTASYLLGYSDWRRPVVDPGEFIAGALLAIDAAEPAQRPAILADLARVAPWAHFSVQNDSPANDRAAAVGSPSVDPRLQIVRDRLWDGARVFGTADPTAANGQAIAAALRRGGYGLVAVVAPRRSQLGKHSMAQGGFWSSLPARIWERSAALFFLCATVLTLWLSGAVVAPLVKLARRAEQFPTGEGAFEPIVESGPREVRELSRALNRMQDRIQSMIDSRSRALAAISHDLRTIITRIRLRSEFIADPDLKQKMLQDAETMDSMLYKNLLYLRGEQENRDMSLIDLDSVLQTIADQFGDMGHAIVYNGGKHQTVYGSLTELQRLFSNLVENAVTYGTKATISAASPAQGAIVVEIADDGPGIPESERSRILEPFVRGQPARNMNAKSGFGLGLAIVQSLVEKTGGQLELFNRQPHGLVARVTLPSAFS